MLTRRRKQLQQQQQQAPPTPVAPIAEVPGVHDDGRERNQQLIKTSSAAMEQPPEVLQDIMEALIFPDVILPYTHRSLIHATGHPRSKILPLLYLCKSWYIAGVPLLYRDVLITKLSQLSLLLDTLRIANCSQFAQLVESVEVRDMLPVEIASNAFQAGVHALLQLCPKLTKFAYTHANRDSESMYSPVYPWLIAPITHLHLQYVASRHELIVALKETSPTLLSLYISFAPDILELDPVRLSMPHLHTLSIPQRHMATLMCKSWSMPSLTRLLFWRNGIDTSPRTWSIYEQKRWVENICSRLEVLEIWPDSMLQTRLNELLEWVPVLTHLILHHSIEDRITFSTPVCHPTLQWIDIWAEDSTKAALASLKDMEYFPLQGRSVELPSIRGIRIFPKHLSEWSHLPLTLAPTPCADRAHVVQLLMIDDSVTWHQWLWGDYYGEEEVEDEVSWPQHLFSVKNGNVDDDERSDSSYEDENVSSSDDEDADVNEEELDEMLVELDVDVEVFI